MLRLGETELLLPGALPIKLLVPPEASMRAIISLPDKPQASQSADLEFGTFTGREGGGLAVSALGIEAVSYTHLDVYKRQALNNM